MKKILAMLLALAMVFSLAACAGETQNSAPPATDTPAAENTPAPAQSEEPSEAPQVDSKVVDFYLQKANEVKVTDDAVIFTDDSAVCHREGLVLKVFMDP